MIGKIFLIIGALLTGFFIGILAGEVLMEIFSEFLMRLLT